MITEWRLHIGVISDIVFVCERPKENHLKLFSYKRNKATGEY